MLELTMGLMVLRLSYTNSCISEYVSCKILKTLGLNSQDTMLGKYNNKIVVACKDFRKKNEFFSDFASLKNTIIESSSGGYDTELSDILETIDTQEQLNIKNDELSVEFLHIIKAQGANSAAAVSWAAIKVGVKLIFDDVILPVYI